MHLFVENEMREGISDIAKRFSQVIIKYMKSYDNIKPSKYIKYLDENNLYGWSIVQHLHYSKFEWLNKKRI